MIKIDEEQSCETDTPQLRVFRGDEENEADDFRPPEPTGRTRREWLLKEAFWAGRNRARRFSARLVA
jgi:hypothetical protein